MSWLAGLILDHTPWWAWLGSAAALLAATYKLWAPLWALTPQPMRLVLAAASAAVLAYLAGRTKGAAGADSHHKEKDTANANRIIEKAIRARADADARDAGGRLRDDDGWKRDR
ncbi:hypothetical protein ACLBXM_20025 [Xanthobacteraceae bacterium A53D]